MRKLITLCALVLLITQSAFATETKAFTEGTVVGTVIDSALDEPLPYVNVIVKNDKGETITGGITTEDGSFKITKIPEGASTVTIQYIGFKTVNKEITISRKTARINLGEIRLEEEASALDEVTVVAEVSTIQQKVDRKVITVGRDLTTQGASASDIMNNLPSVNVDSQSGDISLRGNQNVRVLVDGKPTNVPAAQLLKQIPSTSIKSIELITNPSAKYNPEGMSGIINIVLHKNTQIGFNGNINLGLSKEINAKFNSSIDMNYRNGKFNFYGNYGNNIGKSDNYGNIDRLDDNSRQEFDFGNNNKSHLYKIGIDYYINDKNTFSIYTNQNIYDGKGYGTTDIYYPGNTPSFHQLFNNTNENNTSTYNATYKLDFAKEGHNISIEADYSTFDSDESANFNFSAGPSYIDLVNNKRDNTVINLDYTNPLSEKAKLELGAEYRLNNSENIYDTTSGNLFDSDYEYERSIYSVYATYGKTLEKWSYQIGARFEQYEVQADFAQDTQEDAQFKDDQFSIYPSAFVTYSASDKNSYQLSFSRRVDRPGLGQINPIREWSTPRITSVGNPELRQQFTNSIEFNYTRQLNKGSITAGVFYRAIEDEISRSVSVDPEDPTGDRLILSFDNFDNNKAYGAEISSNYRPTKWWSLNASAEAYFNTVKGVVEDQTAPVPGPQNVEIDNSTFNFRLNNNFNVTKKLSLSLFGMYNGASESLQFNRKPMILVNTGLRYRFLDNKATFSFSYNDIFNTMKFEFDGDRPYPQMGEFNWESNAWRIGLSYRFGGGKYRALSRKRRDNREKSGGGGFM
ncbi:TonB-dependent receptor domain-containing protein [Pontimicrobium sp. IMCC45349]|uniref:TonB-dependent receptor domain-containing protein n=1 Tax=Pontimicrobium sp. IMCC45349 TaxID=3391574 RepID=UPI0039A348F6